MIKNFTLLFVIVFGSFVAKAQAPANNNICNATVITLNAPSITGSFTNATPDGPVITCAVTPDNGTPVRDVWYSFVAPASGSVIIETTAGSNNDTQLQLLRATPAGSCTGTLTVVACNDDISGSNFLSRIVANNLIAGETYFVQVDPWGNGNGTFGIFINSVVNQDLNINAVYSEGKSLVGQPQSLAIRVNNFGLQPVSGKFARFEIRGVNPRALDSVSIPAVANAQGANVTLLASTTPTNLGYDTIIISLSTDDNNANNSATWIRETTTDQQRLAANGRHEVNGFVWTVNAGADPGTGSWVVRYNINSPRVITSVNVYIRGTVGALGEQITGVVYDSSGLLVGESAPLTITAADTGGYVNLRIPSLPQVTAGSYFVGVKQLAGTNIWGGGPGQNEDPSRPNTYYAVGGLGNLDASADDFDEGIRLMVGAVSCDPLTTGTLSSYAPIAPANNTITLIDGLGSQTLNVSWNRSVSTSNNIPNYQWVADIDLGGIPDFNNPALTFTSNNDGLDTTLTLLYQDLFNLLDGFGVDSLDLLWTVRARDCGAFTFASDTFFLRLVKGNLTFILCTPNNTDNTNDFISSFVMGSINKVTGRNQPTQYFDFFNTDSTVHNPGDVVPFTIKMGASPFNYRGAVYVDWDMNNRFDSLGEGYFTGFGLDSLIGASLTGQVSIPSGQAFGTYRMRVIAGDADFTVRPCDVSFGDIEDYALVLGVTGFSIEKLSESFSIFPNPAQDQLTIRLSDIREGQIELINNLGMRIQTQSFLNAAEDVTFNLQSLARGVYFVRVIQNGTVQTRKVILE